MLPKKFVHTIIDLAKPLSACIRVKSKICSASDPAAAAVAIPLLPPAIAVAVAVAVPVPVPVVLPSKL